jgi:hypothetical protein
MHEPDDDVACNRDDEPVEPPARRTLLDVDGGLRGDSVALLGNAGEQDRERQAVLVGRRADPERRRIQRPYPGSQPSRYATRSRRLKRAYASFASLVSSSTLAPCRRAASSTV